MAGVLAEAKLNKSFKHMFSGIIGNMKDMDIYSGNGLKVSW